MNSLFIQPFASTMRFAFQVVYCAATYLFTVLAAAAFSTSASAQDHWPAWRGPHFNGVSDSQGLPTQWSLTKNVAWRSELPSWSGGTPAIWGDRVFVTSASQGDARAAQAAPGLEARNSAGGKLLLLLCLSKKNGAILWTRELDEGNRLWHKQNNASPSPVTDGKHVWAVTGTGTVACFDIEGTPVWKFQLQKAYGEIGINWGYASSPLLFDGKLIIQVLHGMRTEKPSYVIAFHAVSGELAWRVERTTDALRESRDAYTSPAIAQHNGKAEIIISGGNYITGHDIATGKELWRCGGLNPRKLHDVRVIGSPIYADGMIYAPARIPPLIALRAGGSGDVTPSYVAFKFDGKGGGLDVPSPVCDGKYLYIVNDRGIITCLDAKDGSLVYGPERTVEGTVSSSPILADGKIYFVNEHAETVILAAGPTYKMIAACQLDGEYTLSSIATSGSQLFIRTAKALYCIGQ